MSHARAERLSLRLLHLLLFIILSFQHFLLLFIFPDDK